MLMKFDKRIILKDPDLIFNHIEHSYFGRMIVWIINSKYRKAVSLSNWIDEQVKNPDALVQSMADEITTYEDTDEQVLAVLRYVRYNVTYLGDPNIWKMLEYWQTSFETAKIKLGDCEDGAILAYVLCRLKGVHANRVLVFAGDVSGGGHSWLGYRPTEYPLNWVFLDWCYWPEMSDIETRKKFWIDGTQIREFDNDGNLVNSNYYSIWFGFNEDQAFEQLNYSINNQVN